MNHRTILWLLSTEKCWPDKIIQQKKCKSKAKSDKMNRWRDWRKTIKNYPLSYKHQKEEEKEEFGV